MSEPNKTNATKNDKAAPKRKAVESTFADKWEPEKKGDVLEGRYLGFEMADGKRGEPFKAHQIQSADGKRHSVAGAHLDSLLPQVPKGTYIWLTYQGKRDMKNGEMSVYGLEVEEGVELLEVLKDGASKEA